MKKIKIIGAGGFAAELTEYIFDNNRIKSEQYQIEGYFDVQRETYDAHNFAAPFLGSERDYDFSENDIVMIAIGDVSSRYKVANYLAQKGVTIETFIHHSSLVASTCKIGVGNIICPFCIIGPMTELGDYNLLNYQCAIPHDCVVGSYNVLSPNVHVTGYVQIGDCNLFGVSSGTKPAIKIGDHNKIQAGLIVDRNIKNNSIVFEMNKIKTMELYK